MRMQDCESRFCNVKNVNVDVFRLESRICVFREYPVTVLVKLINQYSYLSHLYQTNVLAML